MKRVCKFEGCDGKYYARGYCQSHYERLLRNGSPQPIVIQSKKGIPLSWLKLHINYQEDNCLIWPFGKMSNGYGVMYFRGRVTNPHRLICIFAHGNPPTKKHEAAHSCGNGHLGCVNPKHLRWATPKENQLDKIKHGTMLRGEKCPIAKITKEDVRKIRSLDGTMLRKDIGHLFNLSRQTVNSIIWRKTWAWLE